MMKLVDMRGLKPRPFRGPGSTPGIGTLMKAFIKAFIKVPIPGVEPGPLKGRGFKPRMSTNFII
jgi:hypothetical protein